jgi:putative zinc finger/helix-turn-helix YgiT family protein
MEVLMKCTQCDGAMKVTKDARHRYDESGLKNILLMGVEVRRCDECGEIEVAIPALEQLHQLLARTLILKHDRLTADEIRFLRKHLGLTGVGMAARMGVARETVSRWETGAGKMDAPAERLLRMMVATTEPMTDYAKELEQVAIGASRPLKATAKRDAEHGWRLKRTA